MSEIVVAVTNGRSAGEYLIDMYQVQTKHRKFYLEDVAMAAPDDNGEVKITQTSELTTEKGAKRGAGIGLLAGFLVGGPIGAGVVAGSIGALMGAQRTKASATSSWNHCKVDSPTGRRSFLRRHKASTPSLRPTSPQNTEAPIRSTGLRCRTRRKPISSPPTGRLIPKAETPYRFRRQLDV